MGLVTLLSLGLGAFVLSYLGVAAIRRWALRRNLLDVPNERSSHVVPTPRGGGLAIAAIVLVGFSLSRLWSAELAPGSFAGYMLGALIVAAISGADDVVQVSAKAHLHRTAFGAVQVCPELSRRVRLLVHLLAATVFVAMAGYVNRIYLPFLGNLNLEFGLWNYEFRITNFEFGIPLTLFWIVGLTNAYNFMDGIDGIAAGQAIVAGSLWLIVSVSLGAPALASLSVLVVGASLGFLLHNTPPARIFMGDVGSTVLGFTFAALPILAFRAIGDPRLVICGVLFVAPFLFDTSLTMLRRAIHRENILLPHRSHLYQRLVKLGYSHGTVSILYTVLAFLSSLMGLAYLWGSDLSGSLALLAAILLLVAVAVGVTSLERHSIS